MKKNKRLLYLVLTGTVLSISILFIVIFTFSSFGQVSDTAQKAETVQEMPAEYVNPPPQPGEVKATRRPMTEIEFLKSLLVMAVGFLIIAGSIILIWVKNYDKDTAIKLILVTFIVTATLFLITAGFSNDQIAPAIGLLGTIAGYLLGKSNQPANPKI